MLYALLTSRAGRESNRLSTTLYQRWPYQLPSPPTSAWTKYYFHSHDRSNAQVGIIAGNYGTTPFSIGFGLHFFPKAFFFSWWKSRQNVWMKSDISKSCQIIALLNVNTVIWQVFELVGNRTVWWEIGLFWQVFHHCAASAIMNWISITLTSEQETFKLTFE